MRGLNARGLASRGYTVLQAANGLEADRGLGETTRARSISSSPTWSCRRWTDRRLARELRSRNPDVKIIFVSGYAEEAFQKNLPDHGQYAFLPKPFTLKQLVAAVKETLAG